MMRSIGMVSEMVGIPISTLRYYDREGLFGELPRSSGIRMFGDKEIETLWVIECLKKSGLEIKEIKQLMQSDISFEKKLEIFSHQKELVEKEIKDLKKTLDMLRFKCWYYETAIADGSEEKVEAMLPDNLPEDVQKIYDHAREWEHADFGSPSTSADAKEK